MAERGWLGQKGVRGSLLLEGRWELPSDGQAGPGAGAGAAPSGITSVVLPRAALLREQGGDHSAAREGRSPTTPRRGVSGFLEEVNSRSGLRVEVLTRPLCHTSGPQPFGRVLSCLWDGLVPEQALGWVMVLLLPRKNNQPISLDTVLVLSGRALPVPQDFPHLTCHSGYLPKPPDNGQLRDIPALAAGNRDGAGLGPFLSSTFSWAQIRRWWYLCCQ